jgi:hypothetical protein
MQRSGFSARPLSCRIRRPPRRCRSKPCFRPRRFSCFAHRAGSYPATLTPGLRTSGARKPALPSARFRPPLIATLRRRPSNPATQRPRGLEPLSSAQFPRCRSSGHSDIGPTGRRSRGGIATRRRESTRIRFVRRTMWHLVWRVPRARSRHSGTSVRTPPSGACPRPVL